MIVTDLNIHEILKENKLENIKVAYFSNLQIDKITLSMTCFYNLQYLCLRNNNITEVEFLDAFPNLFALDLRDNQIKNLKFLYERKTWGFLGLSVEKYSQHKLTSITDLNIGIMILKGVENSSYLDKFIENNPNIVKFNDSISLLNPNSSLIDNKSNNKKSRMSKKSSFMNNSVEFSQLLIKNMNKDNLKASGSFSNVITNAIGNIINNNPNEEQEINLNRKGTNNYNMVNSDSSHLLDSPLKIMPNNRSNSSFKLTNEESLNKNNNRSSKKKDYDKGDYVIRKTNENNIDKVPTLFYVKNSIIEEENINESFVSNKEEEIEGKSSLNKISNLSNTTQKVSNDTYENNSASLENNRERERKLTEKILDTRNNSFDEDNLLNDSHNRIVFISKNENNIKANNSSMKLHNKKSSKSITFNINNNDSVENKANNNKDNNDNYSSIRFKIGDEDNLSFKNDSGIIKNSNNTNYNAESVFINLSQKQTKNKQKEVEVKEIKEAYNKKPQLRSFNSSIINMDNNNVLTQTFILNSLYLELGRISNPHLTDFLNFLIQQQKDIKKLSFAILARNQFIKIFEIDIIISSFHNNISNIAPKLAYLSLLKNDSSKYSIDNETKQVMLKLPAFSSNKDFIKSITNNNSHSKMHHHKSNTSLTHSKSNLSKNNQFRILNNNKSSTIQSILLQSISNSSNNQFDNMLKSIVNQNKNTSNTNNPFIDSNNPNELSVFKKFDYTFLIIEENSIQLILLNTLILFILGIVPKELFLYIIDTISKLQLGKYYDINNLIILLKLDIDYLLGLYYFIQEKVQKRSKLTPMQNDFLNKMRFENLYSKVSFLKENKTTSEKRIFRSSRIDEENKHRKILITQLIETFKLNGISLKDVLYLIQNLNDFIIFNKTDELITKHHPEIYHVFILIKEFFFRELNRNVSIYNSTAEKNFYKYIDDNFSNKLMLVNSRVNMKNDFVSKKISKNIGDNSKYINYRNNDSTNEVRDIKDKANKNKSCNYNSSINTRNTNINNTNSNSYDFNIRNIKGNDLNIIDSFNLSDSLLDDDKIEEYYYKKVYKDIFNKNTKATNLYNPLVITNENKVIPDNFYSNIFNDHRSKAFENESINMQNKAYTSMPNLKELLIFKSNINNINNTNNKKIYHKSNSVNYNESSGINKNNYSSSFTNFKSNVINRVKTHTISKSLNRSSNFNDSNLSNEYNHKEVLSNAKNNLSFNENSLTSDNNNNNKSKIILHSEKKLCSNNCANSSLTYKDNISDNKRVHFQIKSLTKNSNTQIDSYLINNNDKINEKDSNSFIQNKLSNTSNIFKKPSYYNNYNKGLNTTSSIINMYNKNNNNMNISNKLNYNNANKELILNNSYTNLVINNKNIYRLKNKNSNIKNSKGVSNIDKKDDIKFEEFYYLLPKAVSKKCDVNIVKNKELTVKKVINNIKFREKFKCVKAQKQILNKMIKENKVKIPDYNEVENSHLNIDQIIFPSIMEKMRYYNNRVISETGNNSNYSNNKSLNYKSIAGKNNSKTSRFNSICMSSSERSCFKENNNLRMHNNYDSENLKESSSLNTTNRVIYIKDNKDLFNIKLSDNDTKDNFNIDEKKIIKFSNNVISSVNKLKMSQSQSHIISNSNTKLSNHSSNSVNYNNNLNMTKNNNTLNNNNPKSKFNSTSSMNALKSIYTHRNFNSIVSEQFLYSNNVNNFLQNKSSNNFFSTQITNLSNSNILKGKETFHQKIAKLNTVKYLKKPNLSVDINSLNTQGLFVVNKNEAIKNNVFQ